MELPDIKNRLENGICGTVLNIFGHSVNLYWMDTAILTDAAVFDAAYRMLPQWRKDKADFYLRASDQRLSVGAGLLFLQGLKDCRISVQDAAVSFGRYGKPRLCEYPKIHFNLSHAKDLAVAVFADTDVGCDVEQEEQSDLTLAERFFCSCEYEDLMRFQESEARDREFCRLWTLKESFVKATGLGLGRLPLDSFEIKMQSDGKVNIRQQVDGAAYGFWWQYNAGMCTGVCVRVTDNGD